MNEQGEQLLVMTQFSYTDGLNKTWSASQMTLWTLAPASRERCSTWSRWRWGGWRRGRCCDCGKPSGARCECHSSSGWRSPPPKPESTPEPLQHFLLEPASETEVKAIVCLLSPNAQDIDNRQLIQIYIQHYLSLTPKLYIRNFCLTFI